MEPIPQLHTGDIPTPLPMQSGRSRWLPAVLTCGIGCVILFILVAVAVYFMVRGTSDSFQEADKVARQFITDVGNGQDKNAYRLISSAWKQVSSPKDFKRLSDILRSNMGTVKSATQKGNWWQSGTGGTQIVLAYDVVGSKGNGQVTMILVSERSQLRVQSCNYNPTSSGR